MPWLCTERMHYFWSEAEPTITTTACRRTANAYRCGPSVAAEVATAAEPDAIAKLYAEQKPNNLIGLQVVHTYTGTILHIHYQYRRNSSPFFTNSCAL